MADAARLGAHVLDHAPAGWDALVRADPNATPAHRSVVVHALASVLPGMSARFVVVERSGELIGGAPLCLERRAGLTWVHALPFLLPAAPLAHSSYYGAEVDAAVADALSQIASEPGTVGGEWSCYRPTQPVAESTLNRVAGVTRAQWAAVIDLEPGASLEPRLDRDDRNKLRHARAGVTLHEEPTALDAVYALHQAQSRGWAGHRPMPLELSRRLLSAEEGGAPAARLFTARDTTGIVAGVLTLDHPSEMFMWWSGARPGSTASRFLLSAVAEWGAARGRTRFNLGGSSGRATLAAFKRTLGAREVPLPVRWLAPAPVGAAARAVAALQAWRRRGRHHGERQA